MKDKERILIYTEMDKSKLKEFKIRYLVYGIVILLFHVALLIIESAGSFKVTKVLDAFFSATMFMGIALGALYITRAFTLKDDIKADSLLLNMENYSFKNINGKDEIKKSFSIIYLLLIAMIVMEMTSFTFFGVTAYAYGFTLATIMAFAVALLSYISIVMSLISLPKELELYHTMLIIDNEAYLKLKGLH